MAVAGGGIPCMPIRLCNGQVEVLMFATNKPAEIVEQDIQRAVARLLAGETFQMHCSGPQIVMVMEKLKEVTHG